MSKMDNKMRPAAPAIPNRIDKTAQDLSRKPLFGANWPACRNHRSQRNDRSRKTEVIVPPVMKRGFKASAPISEIKLSIELVLQMKLKSASW